MAGTITTQDETATGTRRSHPGEGNGPAVRRSRPGRVVVLSLATGFVAAAALAALPFVPVEDSALTGAVLCGFAVGWAMLWLLSSRDTDQPQRWAVVPALLMALSGLLLVAFGSPVREALHWVWPPTLFVLVIWMVLRTRRDMHSRSGRVPLYLVFAVLVASAVGGGYEALGETTDSHAVPSTGRLIDVGGHKLYLSCVGSGSPTVVLEPGAGGTSSQVGWITPDVAARTRVCVYDRAARGWSEPADTPQDGAQIATDLHTLLHRAGETGPYVLAGHSFGGLYVRIFAAHYPDEVAGLALIDSTASKEPARSVVVPAERSSDDPLGRIPMVASLAARVGVARLLGQLDWGELPPDSRAEIRTSNARASWLGSTIDEYMRSGASAQEAASLRDFGDKPLVVVTAGRHPESWMTQQREMLALSTNSAQEIVAGAAHIDLLIDQTDAATTAQAILAVVDSARTGRPLSR
jgi:pimeloyl-ACP methyl ester carboxylesterase